MLISFEGIDGCGKSTQIKLLKDYFNKSGVKTFVFREPGGTEISEKIRNLLLHETEDMDPTTELLLFSAARSQLVAEEIKPRLKKGEIVILDRFFDSTTAYQGYGRKSAKLSHIETLNKLATHHTEPDITFYLRIDPKEAAKRTQTGTKDRMEKSGEDFFREVCKGYDQLSRLKRFAVIDASESQEEIHQKIISRLDQVLN
ncbi:dTMP kinase [Rhodohalobacter sp.]|uniref:dTMP kinase n=1 Tax=Rhodohalobacter sp. TaxID=1974210 RepID=UPI00356592EB